MIESKARQLQRLDDLLADEATQGLADDERRELETMLASHPHVDRDALAWTAAAIDVPMALAEAEAGAEPLPMHLRQRLEGVAIEHLARRRGLKLAGTGSLPDRGVERNGLWASRVGWLAAAAGLALAAIAWWPRGEAIGPDQPQRLAARHDALLDEPGSGVWSWQDNDLGVRGDVVWNNARQEGVLKLEGLRANDPSDYQYQLWIFDEGRARYSESVAVDGGVFDVESDRDVVYIPIRAKLPVFDPSLFAVTTEPPGGVVKHNPQADPDRYRIVLTAPVT